MNALETVTLGAEYLDRVQSRYSYALANWRDRIDLGALDINSLNRCILGQLFGNYEEAVDILAFSEDEDPTEMGFAPNFQFTSSDLNKAWKEYLAPRAEALKPVEYRRNRYGTTVYRSLAVVVSSNGTEHVAYEPVTFPNSVEKGAGVVSLWLKDDYYEDTLPYEHVKWAEGDLLLADKGGKAQAFVVRRLVTGDLRPWILSESPTWADEATWGELSGYKNFRKISF